MREESYPDKIGRLFPNTNKTIKTVTLQVTDDCNLRCTYCYQHNKGHHKMSFETAKKFIDMLLHDELKGYITTDDCSGIVIDFIGGEPLLEIDLIDEITDYIIKSMIELHHPWLNRLMFDICSNGLLYFDRRVQSYMEKNKTHLSFSISIDGNKELHDACRKQPNGEGSYDIAIAGVRDWVKRGGYMGSKMTLSPQNIVYIYDAVKSLIHENYRNINLNCVYEDVWSQEDSTILYYELKRVADYLIDNDLYKKHTLSIFEENFFHPKDPTDLQNWCGGNGQMIALDYKGDIYPCLRYMESSLGSNREPIIIGNINTGFLKTDKQKECVRCLKCIDRRTQSTDECFNCPIAEGCSWCTAYNYEVFGTPDKRATFICEMHKARALANCYFWNRIYQKEQSGKVFINNVPDEWSLKIINKEELNKLKELQQENEVKRNEVLQHNT